MPTYKGQEIYTTPIDGLVERGCFFPIALLSWVKDFLSDRLEALKNLNLRKK